MKLQIKLNEDEHQDIKINDNMVIIIHRGDVGYVIDVYNTNDDLVCTNSIWDDDLDTAVEEPAEALKEACRELKEKAENATRGERYLDEVAEAASEQRDKAMEWCKQQIKEATAKNKSKGYRHSYGLREFLDTITDLDWAEIATRHRERCKRAEEADK